MDNSSKTLSHLLVELRTSKGLSLRDFSEKIGISHAYLSKLEKGIDPRSGRDITPTVETLTKIADGLGIRLDDFMATCGYFESSEMDKTHDLQRLVDQFSEKLLSIESLGLDGQSVTQNNNERIRLAIALLEQKMV